ncbi:uncharacterized protein LOC134291910 [Aedes albopictus]|uniref:Endonuclease n=1 Tax=Aedes albopictus TaxID=7160 RepID=A0ABM1ZLC0_AEDAL
MSDIRTRDQLTTRRTTLIASLSRAEQFVEDFVAERDGLEVQIRLENLDLLWQTLEDVQTALEDLEETNEGKVLNLQYRASFEPRLFRLKARLQSKIPPPLISQANFPAEPPPRAVSTLAGLKLPTISLPEFDGDYMQWLTFHDTFQALIHDNQELPPIQKFHYLRAAVKGDAAQIIETISISAANYPLAWQALVNRYSNEYLLKKRHLQDLLDIPRMKKETAAALHSTVDEFQRHIKILQQLGEPTQSWSTLLEHLLCMRLHDDTIRAWEDHAESVGDQSYTCLVEFLEKRIRVLESISVNHSSHPSPPVFPNGSQRKQLPVKMSSYSATENFAPKCHACDQQHPLVKCQTFERMSLADRLRTVNSKRLCLNCFRQDHFARDCPSNYSCRVCRKNHHTLLHPGQLPSYPRNNGENSQAVSQSSHRSNQPPTSYSRTQSRVAVQSVSNVDEPTVVQCSSVLRSPQPTIFMLTVVLRIVDVYGKEHFARALLDSASQPNLMSDRLAQLLRLKREKVNVLVHGIGEQPDHATDSVTTSILSRKDNFSKEVSFLVLKRMISNLPAEDISIDDWKLPSDISLADPSFNRSGKIDLVLGTQHFFDCFPAAARIKLTEGLPDLVDSVFGWIVAGGTNISPPSQESICCKTVTTSLSSLDESMERFWKIEELGVRSALSIEEKACEELFKSTVSRDEAGRYIVELPKQPNFDEMIGESEATAVRRFEMLERRFTKDSKLKEDYDKFMSEYLSLGHMKLVPNGTASDSKECFLPHHPVVKEASTTTKTRVVFDGSCKTSSGFSLNQALCVGPTIQDELLDLVIRNRKFPVAMTADVEKMYRQVLVHPKDTPLQKIKYRFQPTDPLQSYELLTVTYGLAPSSFLATRALQQVVEDEGSAFPLAAPVVKKSFYVDDFIGGAFSVAEAIQLREELTGMLAKGGFPLRKWTSNKLDVLQGLPADQIGTQSTYRFNPGETVKTLGILWEPESDQFRFDFQVDMRQQTATKRTILSRISQLFDPLGLIAPIVIRGKMLMQELWLVSCSWDEEVPDQINRKWQVLCGQLPGLARFRIDRYAFQLNSVIQLHTFADASEAAYGACVYARCVDTEGNVHVQLLAAKSRVAPLKTLSIPRLELCAALVGSQLHSRIVEALEMNIDESFFWSDSTVVLQWLGSPPSAWKTFVANRVSEVQHLTHGSRWSHVSGFENPADLVSRGMDVDDFVESNLWKYGPQWLQSPELEWPIRRLTEVPEAETERKGVVVAVTTSTPHCNPIFSRYSSFTRLTRIVALCQRFVSSLRSKSRTQPTSPGFDKSQALSLEELIQARLTLVRLAQADCFHEELRELQQGRQLPKRSSLRLLSPFIDTEGVLRVGGRLKLSEQPYLSKHPALLPSFHPLSQLIAKSFHYKLIHGGGHLTLSVMREEYWPINGRRLVRSIIRNCFQCARANPVPASQQIGQLPAQRVTVSKPFSITGVDYAGPVYLKAIHKRAAPTKAYICLFVCFTTKAVHLELVGDLSTPAFISALRRFVARRGRPSHLHSDNGKNFVGAKNELHELYGMLSNEADIDRIARFCSEEEIAWHLNPPKAPHFGGLWEAAIKVAKKHLHRQLGNSRLSYEDLSTVLAEIEAAMNSRPLVPMTEDPNDFTVLTPAHFIVGSTMHAVLSPSVIDIHVSRLAHHQKLQQLFQRFWHQWRTEYLQELQKDTRLRQPNHQIRPGRMVVIVDEFQHPVRWPLARVEAVHPGADGLVRVVTLRTSKGIFKRPITKICLLPTESSNTTFQQEPQSSDDHEQVDDGSNEHVNNG